MPSIVIRTPAELQDYLSDGLIYSALRPEILARWLDRAMLRWYFPLLRDGYGSLPCCVALDLGARAMHPGEIFRRVNPSAPDAALFTRYVHTMETALRDPAIRDVMATIALHRQDDGVAILLKRLLTPVLNGIPPYLTPVDPALTACWTSATALKQNPARYIAFAEAGVRAFCEAMTVNGHDPAAFRLSHADRLYIEGVARQPSAMSFPDLELIERCLKMDDLPPLESGPPANAERMLASIRLPMPVRSPAPPDGGYVGIRNNGGVEDLTAPILSEWAHPSPVLWEKLTNRRLLVYERSASTRFVRSMVIHAGLLLHTEWLQIDPAIGAAPLSDVKWLMAAVVRDIAGYACQARSIEVRLNLQIASWPPAQDMVRTLDLSSIPVETIRRPAHFLLDQPEAFPWFFSTDLRQTAPVNPASGDETGIAEAWVVERDLDLPGHTAGFDTVHAFIFCSERQYPAIRSSLAASPGSAVDIGPFGLDSLVFIVRVSESTGDSQKLWRIEPALLFHREGHAAGRAAASQPLMTPLEIRQTLRLHFLGRLAGSRRGLTLHPSR